MIPRVIYYYKSPKVAYKLSLWTILRSACVVASNHSLCGLENAIKNLMNFILQSIQSCIHWDWLWILQLVAPSRHVQYIIRLKCVMRVCAQTNTRTDLTEVFVHHVRRMQPKSTSTSESECACVCARVACCVRAPLLEYEYGQCANARVTWHRATEKSCEFRSSFYVRGFLSFVCLFVYSFCVPHDFVTVKNCVNA